MSIELTGLKDKIAVVTGAGRMRSIGREIATTLACAGCDVVVTGTHRSYYTDEEQFVGWRGVDSVASEIRAMGRRSMAIRCDIRDESEVSELLDQISTKFGGVDILINNAGSALGEDRVQIIDLPSAEWHRVIDTNLNGTFYMARAFARHMVSRARGGSIVNISSLLARLLSEESGAYATSKVAVNALSTIMATELGPYKIRVNAVCPGVIDTSRHEGLRNTDLWTSIIKNHISLGRSGTGRDVANAVAFLCSEQGAWITGQHIYIDGGHVAAPRYQND